VLDHLTQAERRGRGIAEYEKVLRDFGYDFEGEADRIDWLHNMLDGCRAAKEVAKR